jgi:hypothetical protein
MKRRPSDHGAALQSGAAGRGVLVLVALVVLGTVIWTVYQRHSAPEPSASVSPPAPADGQPPAVANAASQPAIRFPVQVPADAASKSAPTDLGQALAALVGNSAGRSMLQLADFPSRFVATIDNLGRAHAPPSMWPINPAPGRFTISGRGGETSRIASSNSARYDAHVRLIESIDVAQAARLYRSMYPQLQEAYRQLGYPKGYFNDRFVEVIDLMLETPTVEGPVEVRLTDVKGPLPSTRPWVRHEFVDPELEALAAGQKILLRVGSEHRRRLEAKLGAIRSALTTSGTRQP